MPGSSTWCSCCRRAPIKTKSRWEWLLALPFAALLWVPSYARDQPRLAGIPFFYWYQFLWVALSAVLTGVVYRKRHARR